jgi:thiol-disulfide isomerase/thioredoxin
MLLVTVCIMALASPGWGEKPAPDFTLKDVLQGKEYSLSQFRGKVVVINFFTFFCGPCRDEMPDLNKINNELKRFANPGIALFRSSQSVS